MDDRDAAGWGARASRTPAGRTRPAVHPPRTAPTAPKARLTRRRRERGQVALELAGFLPLLLLVGLAAVQLGVAAYAVSQAGTGARAAARSGSYGESTVDPVTAGRQAMSGWLANGADINVGGEGDAVTATARVRIPSLIPGVGDFGTVRRSATMPRDDGDGQG